MQIIVSHPTGNANVKAALQGMVSQNALVAFYTSVAIFPGTLGYALSTIKPLSDLRKRTLNPNLRPFTHTKPLPELCRLLALKASFKHFVEHEKGAFSVDAIYRGLDRKVAADLNRRHTNQPVALYAYEDGACFSFKAAKKLGIPCLYDLPIGYWRVARDILESEKQRWPKWADTIMGLRDSPEKLHRKDEEIALADHVFVASQFTATTLEKFTGRVGQIHTIPYGYPEVVGKRAYPASYAKKLKLLFVGGLSQRKGIADMFAAVANLKNYVSLTVVGRKNTDNCKPLNDALNECNWIPSLPHNEILTLMGSHDVLLFPSLFEGFGLVITEAMSQGTPVITTERTAGPDLIEHGRNGWLVKAGSTEGLQQMIEQLLLKPGDIKTNGTAAMESARNRPWSAYGRELQNKIDSIV